ncbi:PE-PPE domain-containing protein [Mycolicibacterium sp. 018/SC-01/001]|uniref:PE-PPE domain-containing protein n=1 Tax=Mycolicibacterium sp. 018/SC-01/001 TaxID=2592069 RepID=UPI00163D4600|nr:PE-PPE domain-containing protein [Mycolicibacterium sp. 018/SC-01/001]
MNFTAKRVRAGVRLDRAGLVASARETFADLGATASMAQIADAAGVSVYDLQVHFGDRDGLLVAVLADLEQSLREPEPVVRPTLPRPSMRYVVPPIAAAAAALSLATAPPSAAADVDPPSPASVVTISPLWPVWSLDTALQGSLCATNTCSRLDYVPFATNNGVRALDRRLSQATTSGAVGTDPTVVLAFSNGAGVAEKWMAEHAGTPGAPSPDEVSFVLIGNPRRAHGGIIPPIEPTDYHVIDVVRQYDPMADFPDRPLNLLALANVAAGMLSPMHLDYRGVDLDDPDNVVWTEGNTTYVFVPTTELPLLKPLRALGFDELAAKLNGPLTDIIEKAYDRPYLNSSEPPPVEAPEPTVLAAATADTEENSPARRTSLFERVAAEKDSTEVPSRKRARSDDDAAAATSDKPTVTAPPTSDSTPAASTAKPAKKTHKGWGRHRAE